MTVRADSGFWSWKLIDCLGAHNVRWSITVRQIPKVKAAIAAIAESDWQAIAYTAGGEAQVAETTYTAGDEREVRLVVRRTRLRGQAQRRLWPDWRHHAFITDRDDLDTVAADAFHRQHATIELAIRDLKDGAGLEHVPSGHYGANCAWLACAVLAHNISTWTSLLAHHAPTTSRTRRTRLFALPAVLANRSGRPTLRFAARWPWADQFHTTLKTLRALPGPSG